MTSNEEILSIKESRMQKRFVNMLPDYKDKEIEDSNAEDYLPYSFDVATEEIVQRAAIVLNETPETSTKCLKEVRELLKDDFAILNLRMDDYFLLSMLRAKKFDVEVAATAAKNYHAYLDSHRFHFENINLKTLTHLVQTNIIGFLPYRDAKDSAIIYARTEAWDPDDIPVCQTICAGAMSLMYPMRANPLNQVNGVLGIVDLKDLSVKQVFLVCKYIPMIMRCIQRCCLCRLRYAHVINVPPIFKILWKFVHPLISDKMRNRIIFHSSMKSLHKCIPPCILPSELEGHLGPFSNDHWSQDMEWVMQEHKKQMKYGRVSKREKQCLVPDVEISL